MTANQNTPALSPAVVTDSAVNDLKENKVAFSVTAAQTGAYTMSPTDDVIVVGGSTLTITLLSPAAVPVGRKIVVKNNASGATTTIKSQTGNIDATAGSTGVSLAAAWAAARYFSDGTNWNSY